MGTSNSSDYQKGMNYETFMHRAFKTSDHSKPGMHGSIIENFIRIEAGDTSFSKWHGTFEKQLQKIKIYMHKAMAKYLSMRKIPASNREEIRLLDERIDRAFSSDQLMQIINLSIELTQCLIDSSQKDV